METQEMITELTRTVSGLQKDVKSLQEDKNYLYEKLDKAYGDRIVLLAENNKLRKVTTQPEEEECVACSA